MKRCFIILLCACVEMLSAQAQTAFDFRSEHLELWKQADSYARSRSDVWQKIWRGFEIDSFLAEAVVFPEMVRFSKMQNYAETAAVRVRYVAQGSELCDYSIGRFQMKPSFVEKLEKRWMESEMAVRYETVFDTVQSRQSRSARVDRLEQESWQCTYVAMFIRLLYIDYPQLAQLSIKKQVTYVAAAYNHGCPLPGTGKGKITYIEQKISAHTFHTVILAGKSTPRYVYPEIALLRYNERTR